MIEKSTSGFFFAAASVASPSRKPTVVIDLQPSFTIALDVVGVLRVGLRLDLTRLDAVLLLREEQAVVRRLVERLVVETTRVGHHAGLEVGVALGAPRGTDVVSLGSAAEVVGPSPQAVRARDATPTTSAIRAVFFTASS